MGHCGRKCTNCILEQWSWHIPCKARQLRVVLELCHKKVRSLHSRFSVGADRARAGSSQRLCKGDLASLIIPSSAYLFELDPDNARTLTSLKKELKADRLMYEYLLCTDKTVEGW